VSLPSKGSFLLTADISRLASTTRWRGTIRAAPRRLPAP